MPKHAEEKALRPLHLFILTAFLWALTRLAADAAEAGSPTADEASRALQRAFEFFRTRVSVEGGYLWRYRDDLALPEGEGRASATTAWVQPPGTPSVGAAYLAAYDFTGKPYLLEAARETAMALVKGQLRSGGWDYRIEFAPQDRRRYAYRIDGHESGRNSTTLDDNTTQAALRFLMQVDQTLNFQDPAIHEAAEYALDALLKAQYPNGAWPQRFSEFPDPDQFPVRKASYPDSWSRTWPADDYHAFYTLNDNTLADTIETMLLAADVYDDSRYRRAAERAGDFILLAQMPDPQPAWAQQYNPDMHPAWARKFEPPSITGGESQRVLQILLELYRRTGQERYLEPIPRALEYLKNSRLPDGRLARFYELKTNRPLFFVKDTYELTYSSDNPPTHYSFVIGSRLEVIEGQYQQIRRQGPDGMKPTCQRAARLTPALAARARAAIDGLDERGAWVEAGRLRSYGDADQTGQVIEARTFAVNIRTLAEFLAAVGRRE